jgi:hypothetical protein
MLHTPGQKRGSSSLPTILVVLACASVAAYFAFFRGKTDPSEPTPAAAAAVVEEKAPAPPPAPVIPKPVEVEKPAPAPKPEPPKPEPKVEPAKPSAIHEVDGLMADGKWREARMKVSSLFSGALPDGERAELARRGLEINQKLLQDKADSPDVELYEIRQGDTLEGIAKKFKNLNGVKGNLMLVNNYKENAILREGRKVRITKGTWSVVVDKTLYTLWICYEGAPFKAYRITIGAENKPTPVTKFTVGNKNPKPAWWPPADMKVTGKIPVPYGDPQNPLGEWWIALDHDLHHGIGIHGTNDPGSIGSKASNGCVRMLNEEVVEVAAIAYKGMFVTVVE